MEVALQPHDSLDATIEQLRARIEMDHFPITLIRGGILFTVQGRYQPCGSCGRPRTINPGDAEGCPECNDQAAPHQPIARRLRAMRGEAV